MIVTCLYRGESLEEYLVQVEASDRELLQYWDYYLNNNASLLVDIKKHGFNHNGIKEKVSYIGATFAIITLYLD